ncbi:MHYT domain-containing protein [Dongia sp.]|uniref:sensor histidine kinase n=1 Tax=Dongia sp. TaxID=1977262 RepID=UPI003750C01B
MPPVFGPALEGDYDLRLVALACVIAVFASFASLNLAGRIRSSTGGAKLAWLCGAAVSLGGGIWSMHFVAMLAFSMPVLIQYDFAWTVASMAMAILAVGAGYALIAFGSLKPVRLILAGLVTGIGVVIMHYAGMEAMLMQATIAYDRTLFVASVLIAVTAAAVALWLSFRLDGLITKLGASFVMGAAIAGMHFTGMFAATFSLCLTGNAGVYEGLDQRLLAVIIAGAAFVILSLGLASALFDQRLSRQATASAAELTRSEKRFRALVGASFDIIAVLDAEGRILYGSPSAKRVLGYGRDALIGRLLTEIAVGEDEAATRSLIERLRGNAEGAVSGEIRCRTESGAVVDLEFHGSNHLDDPDVGGLVINLRDITERNRVGAELRAAKARAESANESKSKFLANVSHELRTPLNSIIGFSDLLKTAPHGPLGDPRYGGFVEDINKSGKYLLTVINSLLDYTKADSGHLRLENILVDPMAEAKICLRLFEEQVAAKMLDFKIEPVSDDFMLMLDRSKLRQILINLISNAVKFTPDHGKIALRAYLETDRSCVINVQDNGIGMSDADVAMALQPFGKAGSNLLRGDDGAGLGLPLAKALVELHGGKLEIASARDLGTLVRIILPPDRVKYVAAADRPGAGSATVRLIAS